MLSRVIATNIGDVSLDTVYIGAVTGGRQLSDVNVTRTIIVNRQDAQLSQRDRAAGCVTVLAKSGRVELRDNILRIL